MSELTLLITAALPLVALLLYALVEVIRRSDLSGGHRAAWLAALLLVPVIGLAAYLVARPPRPVKSSTGRVDTSAAVALVVAAERRQRGELTDGEYHAEVARSGSVSKETT